MAYDYEENKRRQISSMKSIMNYGMGFLFLLLGIFFLLHQQLGIEFSGVSDTPVLDIVFGIIAVIYGGWRIYRGYTKKYFK